MPVPWIYRYTRVSLASTTRQAFIYTHLICQIPLVFARTPSVTSSVSSVGKNKVVPKLLSRGVCFGDPCYHYPIDARRQSSLRPGPRPGISDLHVEGGTIRLLPKQIAIRIPPVGHSQIQADSAFLLRVLDWSTHQVQKRNLVPSALIQREGGLLDWSGVSLSWTWQK